MPLEPTPPDQPRSARWQGEPAGAFSAGSLRSPCQEEGAEGLDSPSAPGVFPGSWAPLGAAGALAPPAAHGSRAGFAAEGEDGAGAGRAGAKLLRWTPPAASGSCPG